MEKAEIEKVLKEKQALANKMAVMFQQVQGQIALLEDLLKKENKEPVVIEKIEDKPNG